MRPEFDPPVLTPTEIPPILIVGGFTGTGSDGSGTLMLVPPPLEGALGVPTVGGAGSEPPGVVMGRLGSVGTEPPPDGSGSDGREGVVGPDDPPTAAAMPFSTGVSPLTPAPGTEECPPVEAGTDPVTDPSLVVGRPDVGSGRDEVGSSEPRFASVPVTSATTLLSVGTSPLSAPVGSLWRLPRLPSRPVRVSRMQ